MERKPPFCSAADPSLLLLHLLFRTSG